MKAYTRTDFMVLRNGTETAVIRVDKAQGKELFRDIIDVEIVSLPRIRSSLRTRTSTC